MNHSPRLTSRLKKGAWVRLKQGVYKGDLARVERVDLAQNRVQVRAVPRIDYNNIKTIGERARRARKGTGRPPQRAFDLEKLRSLGADMQEQDGFFVYRSKRYRGPFLYQWLRSTRVDQEGVTPHPEELRLFQDPDETGPDVVLAAAEHAELPTVEYRAGDVVQVISGDLRTLMGRVVDVRGASVVVAPDYEDLTVRLGVCMCECMYACVCVCLCVCVCVYVRLCASGD